MAIYLKRGDNAEAFDRAKVEATVSAMLEDIRVNREDAVLKYARDLDKWNNPQIRISDDRIRQVEAMLPETWKGSAVTMMSPPSCSQVERTRSVPLPVS